MKIRHWLFWVMLFAVCGSWAAYGQRANRRLRIPSDKIKVDLSLQKAPDYLLVSKSGSRNRAGNVNIPEDMRMWLTAEICFSLAPGPQVREPVMLNGMRVELYLYVPRQGRIKRRSRWFFGVQNLYDGVVFDPAAQQKRDYWASLFLPPGYVYAYLPAVNGRYELKDVKGVVIITGPGGRVLGRQAFSYRRRETGRTESQLYALADKLRGDAGHFAAWLWPREKTPWQWLDADRYELPLTEITVPSSRGAGAAAKGEKAANAEESGE